MNGVLLPYKFTLLSNLRAKFSEPVFVLLPYKFTLLSNPLPEAPKEETVLLPYKFTLLSNNDVRHSFSLCV